MPKTKLTFTSILFIAVFTYGFTQPLALNQDFRKSFIAEVGLGSIYSYQIPYNHPNEAADKLLSFNSFPNANVAIGANAKIGFVQFEVKLGYGYCSYNYKAEDAPGMKGSFITHYHDGTVNSQRFWIQPLGLNFGKDRIWGSWFFGGFWRVNLIHSVNTQGISSAVGQSWNGTGFTPINETHQLEELFSFTKQNLGLQLGTEIKLNHYSQIQIRSEWMPLFSNIPSTIKGWSYTFQVGYIFNLKAYKKGY